MATCYQDPLKFVEFRPETCPKCAATRHWRLADGRWRCANCKTTWHDRTGRWLGKLRISPQKWAEVVAAFAKGDSIRQIARKSRLSYNTARKAARTLQEAILASEFPDFYAKWRVSRGQIRAVAIRQCLSGVKPHLPEPAALDPNIFGPKTADLGNGMAGFVQGDSLVLMPAKLAPAPPALAPQAVGPWALTEVVEGLRLTRAVRAEDFALFVGEAVFRFRRRDTDLVPILTGFLAQRGPDSD